MSVISPLADSVKGCLLTNALKEKVFVGCFLRTLRCEHHQTLLHVWLGATGETIWRGSNYVATRDQAQALTTLLSHPAASPHYTHIIFIQEGLLIKNPTGCNCSWIIFDNIDILWWREVRKSRELSENNSINNTACLL